MYSICWLCLHSICCSTKESEIYPAYKHRKLMLYVYCTVYRVVQFYFCCFYYYFDFKFILFIRLWKIHFLHAESFQDTEKEERVGIHETFNVIVHDLLIWFSLLHKHVHVAGKLFLSDFCSRYSCHLSCTLKFKFLNVINAFLSVFPVYTVIWC